MAAYLKRTDRVRPCASPARMRTVYAAGSLNWSSFSTSTVLTRLKWNIPQSWTSLAACQLCLPPHRQTGSWGLYSHTGPPWYSPLFSALCGPESPGGNSHPSHVGWQTVEDPCGLPFAFAPTGRSGPGRLFRRSVTGLLGRRPES